MQVFSKKERLLKPAEFKKVLSAGRRYSTKSLKLCVLENGLGRNRLGISVSARVAKAVVRTRIKRLIREYFRLNKSDLLQGVPPESTIDIVITVKRADTLKGLEDVYRELKDVSPGRPRA